MVVKNLPWAAEWFARAGYGGHLVRDLSNTHVMIVGGGTLVATGLSWYVLPRIVGRPLASDGLAQCAFWFTAVGLFVFYVALVGNGIAIGRLVAHGWEYRAAKAHMGKLYKVPVGVGAGVMGLGYWCFAANVVLTVFHARLVRVPKPDGHLSKYVATGAFALTVGTVQGVLQVTPAHADWLYRAGHAGEWIDPISHAHVNLVTGLTMLVAAALFQLAPRLGGTAPSARAANWCYGLLLAGSAAFYLTCLYLGFHEGRLVVGRGLTPEQAEQATPLHPFLIVGSGVAMFAAFWFLLVLIVRAYRGSLIQAYAFCGCAALAVGTLQGPVQAFPVVNELLDRGGEAGDRIVNLHAQLNMLAGLMVLLIGVSAGLVLDLARGRPRGLRLVLAGVPAGMGLYYGAGVAFAAVEAHRVTTGRTFPAAVRWAEPWEAVVLVPAALAVLAGFAGYAVTVWRATAAHRAETRIALRTLPRRYGGHIPARVRRRKPAALAGYELPMALLGFPGVGWLFAGFPLTATVLLLTGPAFAWAVVPISFSPYGDGPLRGLGMKVELVYLPVSALLSAAALYRAHRRRRLRLMPPRPRRGRRIPYRARVAVAAAVLGVLLVSLPLVGAVGGVGTGGVRYAYLPRLTPEVTGQFLVTARGPVKLFSWSEPRDRFPGDALRLHAVDVRGLLARAAALDGAQAYQLFDLGRSRRVPLEAQRNGPRQLRLVPARALRPGSYVYTATHEGMFGGRDYAYLRVVAPGAPVTAISSTDRGTRAIAKALPPVVATLVAAAFAFLLLRSFRRRPGGQKLLWAVGFALFATATAAEGIAQSAGWSGSLFRLYYLCGGVLTVAFLGAGSAWLQLRTRGRDVLVGALATATLAAAATVALAPVKAHLLVSATSGAPPANGALGGHAFLWAIALNSAGTLALVGGSLLSLARRRNVAANAWIGGGALVVALGTGLSRVGTTSFVELAELVGISLMFCGFTLTGKPRRDRPPAEAPLAAAARAR
jgi:hypothetical protein